MSAAQGAQQHRQPRSEGDATEFLLLCGASCLCVSGGDGKVEAAMCQGRGGKSAGEGIACVMAYGNVVHRLLEL